MLSKICNFLMTILFIILIAVAGLLFVPKFIGYESFAVISGSMEPNIPVGAIVYVKETPFDNIQVGDAISYSVSADTRVTHRVTAIDEASQTFTTKGDANNVEDGTPVAYQNVIGKVIWSLPCLGYISIYIRTPLGIAAACAIIFIMILLNFLPDIFAKEEDSVDEQK